MKRCVWAGCVLILSWGMCTAGDNKWTSSGPLGGAANRFAFHPRISGLISTSPDPPSRVD
ncbi:MAG: hypothetical protein AB1714_26200 [Acidobacteriota bacterium]